MGRGFQIFLSRSFVGEVLPFISALEVAFLFRFYFRHLGKQGQTPSEAAPSKRRCLSQVKLKATPGIEGCALSQARAVPPNVVDTTIGQLALCPGGGDGGNSWL
jgi:hypothetical protein